MSPHAVPTELPILADVRNITLKSYDALSLTHAQSHEALGPVKALLPHPHTAMLAAPRSGSRPGCDATKG